MSPEQASKSLAAHPIIQAAVHLLTTRAKEFGFGWYCKADTKGMMESTGLSMYQMAAIWHYAIDRAKAAGVPRSVKITSPEAAAVATLAKMIKEIGTDKASDLRDLFQASFPKLVIEDCLRSARTVAAKLSKGRRKPKVVARKPKAPMRQVPAKVEFAPSEAIARKLDTLERQEASMGASLAVVKAEIRQMRQLLKLAVRFERIQAKHSKAMSKFA